MPAWVRLKKMEMFPYFIAPGFTESLTLMSIIDLVRSIWLSRNREVAYD